MIFKAKVKIDICTQHFRVYTVATETELREVLDLRARCFAQADLVPRGFDFNADHLVVRSLSDGKIYGSYSVTHSDFSKDFESATAFNVQEILDQPGAKLELGWACIAPEARDGVVIALLWRGLAAFIRQTQARFVFGVTSVFENDPQRMDFIKSILPSFSGPTKSISVREQRILPPLLRAYLRAGAKVWDQPMFDDRLGCFDFMTVLELEHCRPSVENHFRLCE